MFHPLSLGRALAVALLAVAGSASAGTSAATIVDDATLNSAVAAARTEYNATRGGTPRLHACLLVKQPDGTWKRGSYEGTTTSYPASTVKLCYLASGMYFASSTGRAYNWLDSSMRPMITVSDNNATGVVVDNITGAPNTSTGDFNVWANKRKFTENFLSARGLLGNQRAMHKTYPTNSGSSPASFEQQALSTFGSNQLQPNLMAELMLEIAEGALEPGASAYMRDLLTHDRFSLQSPLGWGVPPGSIYQNKAGWTSTTLNDVAWVKLPNGREFILAVFSNAYAGSDPGSYTNAALGPFMDLVIEKAGLDAGGPVTLRLDNTSSAFTTTGTWSTETSDYDKYKTNYRWANGGTTGTATWSLSVPTAGEYEVSMWWMDDSARTSGAKVTINSTAGAATQTLDMRTRGGTWVPLGKFNFNTTGGSVVINSGTSATGRVIADAIRLQQVPAVGADMVIDNLSPGYTEVGSWGSSTGTGFYNTNSRFASIGTGNATATFQPPLTATEKYNVYAWWVASSNRTTAATYTVTHSGGTTNVVVNQTAKGGQWNLLGAFDMAPGAGHKVVLTNNATTGSVVSADAVRFTEAGNAPATGITVDNTDAGFSASANWTTSTSTPGYLGANYRVRATAATTDPATWTASLPTAGTYKVSARWTAGTNRPASAPYIVTHAGGNTTVNMNQQTNNGTWVTLGTWSFNAGTATVKLSCWTTTGFFAIADAVRFEKQ